MANKSDDAVISVYAQALFQQAGQDKVLDTILAQTSSLQHDLLQDATFNAFICAPHVRPSMKHDVINQLMGKSFHPLLINLVHLAVDKNHGLILKDIVRAFVDKVDRDRNIWPARVTSASELDDGQKDQLNQVLSKLLDKKLHIHYRTNPDLIGGLVFRCDDLMIDQSISGKLHKLKDYLEHKIDLRHL
ncbi:MAG: ATP synthase F1 subunit delta [Bacteriovoracaceae bacterium]|nr:ATP synthase F1 subunit delta [Bacteriovoracaceae bacterium]